MTDSFDLTPAQSGLLDEMKATPVSRTDDGRIIAKRDEDNAMLEIDAEGSVRELGDEDLPQPIVHEGGQPQPEQAPETIAGTAVEVTDSDDPDQYRPPEVALAVQGPDDVFRAMDAADEQMILDELLGRVLDTMVYSFSQGGQMVTDLTVAGVNETIRLMNTRGGAQIGISKQPPVTDEFSAPDASGEIVQYVRVMVFAVDARFPESGRWGLSTEAKYIKKRGSDQMIWDKFAATKALNKAQRNALKQLIPENWRQYVIAAAIGQGRVRTLKAAEAARSGEEPSLPPPLDDDRAKELEAEVKAAFDELRELNALALLPGRFGAKFDRARSSHEALEALRDEIRAQTEHEREKAGGE